MSGRIPEEMMNTSFSSTPGTGKPIQIIDITEDHKFKLNEDNLQSILSHPKAKQKKVEKFYQKNITMCFFKMKFFYLRLVLYQ